MLYHEIYHFAHLSPLVKPPIYPRGFLLVKQTQRQNLPAHSAVHTSAVLSMQPRSRSIDHELLCSRIKKIHLAWDSRGANYSLR
jgi:hypothetical protein